MRSLVVSALACIIAFSATVAPVVAVDPAFHLEPVVSGLKRPLYVASHAGTKFLYVVEQRGIIKVLRRDSATAPWAAAGTFLDIRHLVAGPLSSRGLLGMAFHPNYANNGYFYVFYGRRDADPTLHGDIRIAEFRRSTNLRAKPGSLRVVLDIPHPTPYHLGGWMAFGTDGYMYASTGDAGLEEAGYAEDTNSRLAKILRFNPRKSEGVAGFVPADNPFVGVDGDDLVWAYGVRHPWRASFDRASGELWLPDVGQYAWEEVNRFSSAAELRGADLGWAYCEGTHVYPEPVEGPAPCAAGDSVVPLIEYGHTDVLCSIIGGYVNRAASQPTLSGRYFYGDYCAGTIWSVPSDYESGEPIAAPLDTDLLITSFGQDATGEVYLTALNGTVWQIVAD